MAPSAHQFAIFLLLTLLSSLHTTHARDSQFFNKIPTTTTAAALPTTEQQLPNNQQLQPEQEPDFIPENQNSYGLYSHESGQLPPSATAATTTAQPLNKHLPKNYNPVSYVTEPDDINDSSAFTQDKSFSTNPTSYNYNAASTQNYYNTQQEQVQEPEFRNYPSTTTPDNNNERSYYMGGSSFNSQPQGMSDNRLRGGDANNFNNGFRPQGMSDTRFLENGKYFYDVNSEKYSTNHPYESLKGDQYSNNMNLYGNRGNNYEFNNQNQEEFQNRENYNMP